MIRRVPLIPSDIVLKRHTRTVRLIPDTLPRADGRPRIDHEIVQPRRHGAVRDVRVGQRFRLVLGLAIDDGDVAICAGEDRRRALGVDLKREVEVDIAVAVVLAGADWVAEVARGRGGERKVAGSRGAGDSG